MHIVIIGNGITGTTAARTVRQLSGHEITVISSESNFFFSRTALMYVYMGHMKFEHIKPYEDWFWEKNSINLVHNRVDQIDSERKQCILSNGEKISYDKLIIACGSKPNKFGWPGENLNGVQGLYSLQDLESMEKNTSGISNAVIVGGGLIGIEMAEMLHTRGIPVTMLVREKNYWGSILPAEEAQLVNREISLHGIELHLQTQLKEILAENNGKVSAVITDKGERIPCDFVGLTAGVSPAIDWLKDSSIELNRGILVNEYFETNITDVYAAGDCAEFRTPKPGQLNVEQLWYTGRKHGEILGQILCGKRTAYDRGIWFNSAKFFNIEYQTYGTVPAKIPEDLDSLYWEHANGKKSIRIVYQKDGNIVKGFNLFGIRYRQNICESWIAEGKTLDYVLKHLQEANFDPEFFRRYEREVRNQFAHYL
ncbi:MAG: NAD(P)/FAD-dependent oxidoreductase [Chitinophagales bacterium]|nr:NAD(P)/FAD-dependent oxidoreductase [Chitinophagales bacterium]